jgi:hypothetical protein
MPCNSLTWQHSRDATTSPSSCFTSAAKDGFPADVATRIATREF